MTPRAKVMTSGDAAHGPTVGAGVMRGLLELAVSKGADRVTLLKQSGVELNALYDPDARIAVSTYIDLMRAGQAPVFFESDKNALLIPDSWSSHKIAPRQGYAFGVLSAHADGLMASLEQLTTVRGRVEAELMSILHKGVVTVDAVAANLGVSRRTLARRLKAEATTYEVVLDELRLNLALNYLEGSRVSVTETSYLIGFSDPASFSRAFKRWTGSSPREKAEKKTNK